MFFAVSETESLMSFITWNNLALIKGLPASWKGKQIKQRRDGWMTTVRIYRINLNVNGNIYLHEFSWRHLCQCDGISILLHDAIYLYMNLVYFYGKLVSKIYVQLSTKLYMRRSQLQNGSKWVKSRLIEKWWYPPQKMTTYLTKLKRKLIFSPLEYAGSWQKRWFTVNIEGRVRLNRGCLHKTSI